MKMNLKSLTKLTTKKYLLIGIGSFAAIALLTSAAIVSGISFTGFFKAFDKTVYSGTDYTRNITIRKFYNASVRFTKGNSTSYLKFGDNESVVILKDADGNEIFRMSGVEDGYSRSIMDNSVLSGVATVSVYNLSGYGDVVDQTPTVSTVGTKAYITVRLEEAFEPASISGHVIDDLTGEIVDGVRVVAFEDGAMPENSTAVTESVSDSDGKYLLTFDLDSSEAFDIYVEGYYATS